MAAMAAAKRGSTSSAGWAAPLLVSVVFFFAAVVPSSEAHVFYAGDRDGWVVDPAESYNHWAERNRFQVNDTIVFRHGDGGASPVLLVTEQGFDACDTSSPAHRLDEDGDRSVFRFDRSGPFFFIDGDEDRCQKGQKLYIVVMAVRPKRAPVDAAPAPAPEYAQAPEIGAPSPYGDVMRTVAPPPTSSAAGLDRAIVSVMAAILGALAL